MADSAVLYYLPLSHYCVSVERMLAFKQIPARRVYAAYHDRQELLRRTGQDYVPTLIWKGQAVTWTEIPEFLDRLRPNPPLLPAGQEGLARTLENWGHQVLEERVWRAVVTQAPKVLRSDEERWVFEEMQTRARGPWKVLAARRPEFVKEMLEYFEFVEGMVRVGSGCSTVPRSRILVSTAVFPRGLRSGNGSRVGSAPSARGPPGSRRSRPLPGRVTRGGRSRRPGPRSRGSGAIRHSEACSPSDHTGTGRPRPSRRQRPGSTHSPGSGS